MTAGDAQRVWFPEMIEALRSEWRHGMSFEATVELRDELDAMLQRIRSERHIRPRSLNVRSVGMLVKAHSLMSAFVQCSCRSYDSISSAPSRPRRLKSVGRCTGSRTNSTFLAKLGDSHLPRCHDAVIDIHRYDKPTLRPSDIRWLELKLS